MTRTISPIAAIMLLAAFFAPNASAQDPAGEKNVTENRTAAEVVQDFNVDKLSDGFLDSLNLNKDILINDYTMIGVQYGVGMSRPMWSPSMKQKALFTPVNFGILYTRYGKMFNYMPYFGIQAGLFYTQEGYNFEKDEEGFIQNVEGATKAVLETIELPVMAHFHFDFWKMKVMAHIGLFGGYRLSIRRIGEGVPEEIRNSFLKTDNRWDYGLKGGLGFAFVFDPFELHFNATYKHSLSSLYQPDYHSEYYYRFAYPTNLVFSVGLHFQLTKRVGKTRHEMIREAKEQVGLIKSLDSVAPDKEKKTTPKGLK